MPLKTKQQLEEIAQQIARHTTHEEAIQLLDKLQVDGAMWVADLSEEVLERKENQWEYGTNVACKTRLAVEEALKNRD